MNTQKHLLVSALCGLPSDADITYVGGGPLQNAAQQIGIMNAADNSRELTRPSGKFRL